MNALDSLKESLQGEKLIAVTCEDEKLNIKECERLLAAIDIDDLNRDVIFYTEKSLIIPIVQEDYWKSTVFLKKVNRKANSKKENTPVSLADNVRFTDPKTGKQLPFKTDAYKEKERKEKEAKEKKEKALKEERKKSLKESLERLEKELSQKEKIELDDYQIYKGGNTNSCAYLTLPSSFGVTSREIHNNLSEYVKEEDTFRVDAYCFSALKNDKLEPIRYIPDDNTNDIQKKSIEIYKKNLEERKILVTIGISPEAVSRTSELTPLEIIKNLKKRMLKNL